MIGFYFYTKKSDTTTLVKLVNFILKHFVPDYKLSEYTNTNSTWSNDQDDPTYKIENIIDKYGKGTLNPYQILVTSISKSQKEGTTGFVVGISSRFKLYNYTNYIEICVDDTDITTIESIGKEEPVFLKKYGESVELNLECDELLNKYKDKENNNEKKE